MLTKKDKWSKNPFVIKWKAKLDSSSAKTKQNVKNI